MKKKTVIKYGKGELGMGAANNIEKNAKETTRMVGRKILRKKDNMYIRGSS